MGRPNPAEVKQAKAEAAKAGRQRCLCSHQRRRHAYTSFMSSSMGLDPKSRPCMVARCNCANFILVQRSIL